MGTRKGLASLPRGPKGGEALRAQRRERERFLREQPSGSIPPRHPSTELALHRVGTIANELLGGRTVSSGRGGRA